MTAPLNIIKWRGGQIVDSTSMAGHQSTTVTPYESAGYGRRAVSWFAPGSGPNNTLIGSLVTLRNRSRAGYRNNPWIRHGINRLVSNEIGTGIVPRSRAKDDNYRVAANALFQLSTEELDAEGRLDFYGLQTLAARTRNMAGECFIRRRPRSLAAGLQVPMQIQVLEPEYCPHHLYMVLRNGNVVRSGIEFNKRNQRVAYWMYPAHPWDDDITRINIGKLLRIPAKDVIHVYVPLRPGQDRGEVVTAQALLKAFTLDSYDDAELVRKQTRAPFTGFLEKAYEGEDGWKYDPITGDPVEEDADGVPSMNVEAGTFISGLMGEKLTLFDGDNTGQGYADFMRQQLLGLATGLDGIPYELLSGDWSKVNDRLVRSVLGEFRRGVEALQNQITIHQMCRPVWYWWMDAAVMAGKLYAPGYADSRADYVKHDQRAQGWPYLSPQTDITAKKSAIAGNLSSLENEVAKTGHDVDEIQDQNIAAEKRMVEKRRLAGLPDYPPVGQQSAQPPAAEPNDSQPA